MLSLYNWIFHSSELQMQGHVHQNFIIVCLMKHESGSTVRLARERHVGLGEAESDNSRSLPPSIHARFEPPFPSATDGLNFNVGGNEPNADWKIDKRLPCIFLVPSCDSTLSQCQGQCHLALSSKKRKVKEHHQND